MSFVSVPPSLLGCRCRWHTPVVVASQEKRQTGRSSAEVDSHRTTRVPLWTSQGELCIYSGERCRRSSVAETEESLAVNLEPQSICKRPPKIFALRWVYPSPQLWECGMTRIWLFLVSSKRLRNNTFITKLRTVQTVLQGEG